MCEQDSTLQWWLKTRKVCLLAPSLCSSRIGSSSLVWCLLNKFSHFVSVSSYNIWINYHTCIQHVSFPVRRTKDLRSRKTPIWTAHAERAVSSCIWSNTLWINTCFRGIERSLNWYWGAYYDALRTWRPTKDHQAMVVRLIELWHGSRH